MNKKIIIGSLVIAAALLGTTSIALAAQGNYQNWRSTMGNRASSVTEANFGQYEQMHQMMATGDYAGAEKIRTELGLGRGNGNEGRGQGMHQGTGIGRQAGSNANGNFIDENKNGICDHSENLK
ncbi:MAG: hypothetical protein WC244_01565 [Patescibacteria group bacterium]|jgi:hypothetical protein